jgi:hypothetical protein
VNQSQNQKGKKKKKKRRHSILSGKNAWSLPIPTITKKETLSNPHHPTTHPSTLQKSIP